MTNEKKTQRTRLTHAQWHQVAVYVSSCVDPGTNQINATPSELIALVAQNVGVPTSASQLRDMCRTLGLTIKPEQGAASLGTVAIQVAQLEAATMEQAGTIERLLEQVTELSKNLASVVERVRSHQQQLDNVEVVLRQHGDHIEDQQQRALAGDLTEQQQGGVQ